MSKANDLKFAKILADAFAAGAAAGEAVVPVPMVVNQHENPIDDNSPVAKSWFVSEGVCGFGWVHIKGNTAFGKWARKNGHARPDYPNGLAISSKLMTQSMARNEAWAYKVAEVLRDNGIADASGRSRID